jgi:hypothetical protein
MQNFAGLNREFDLNISGISAIPHDAKPPLLKEYSDHHRKQFIDFLQDVVDFTQDGYLPIILNQTHTTESSSKSPLQTKSLVFKTMEDVLKAVDKLKAGSLMLDVSPHYSEFLYTVELYSERCSEAFAYRPRPLRISTQPRQSLNLSEETSMENFAQVRSGHYQADANATHMSIEHGGSTSSQEQSLHQHSQGPAHPVHVQAAIRPVQPAANSFIVNNTSHGIEGEACQDVNL